HLVETQSAVAISVKLAKPFVCPVRARNGFWGRGWAGERLWRKQFSSGPLTVTPRRNGVLRVARDQREKQDQETHQGRQHPELDAHHRKSPVSADSILWPALCRLQTF